MESSPCPECGKDLTPHRIVCDHCQHTLESPASSDDEAQALLIRSGAFLTDIDDALDACYEYVNRFPDGPAVPDVQLTSSIIRMIASVAMLLQKEFPQPVERDYEVNSMAAGLVSAGLPDVLANGVVVSPSIANAEKRETALKLIQHFQDLVSAQILVLFEEAQREALSLFGPGGTRAQEEHKTMEDIYDDAEVYYAAYEDGDMDGALRGFAYLKEMNPMDAYFRNMLGSIHSAQGNGREAVKELLWGFHLDPAGADIRANLMRELTAMSLHPAALELLTGIHRQDAESAQDANPTVEVLGSLAEVCMVAWPSRALGVGPADIDSSAQSLLETLPYPDRPWFSKRPESGTGSGLLDGRRLFISYRRADSGELAQQIQRSFKTQYPSTRVFIDEMNMIGGKDFTDQIREEIESSDAFLLLVGPYWRTAEGRGRLADTSDVLRREVTWAFRKHIPILPVLAEDATMPAPGELPEELRQLAKLHAERVRSEHLKTDLGQLQKSLIRVITEQELLDRASEQRADELADLAPDEWEEEMQKELDAFKPDMLKYVPAKSSHGEGIAQTLLDFCGVWECSWRDKGRLTTLRVEIGDRPQFTGELTEAKPGGKVLRREELRGEWAQVLDADANLVLGLHLNAVQDGTSHVQLTVPFHEQVGDMIVGTIAGVEYASRKVESRPGGF